MEFIPESGRHWTPWKYWRKVNNIAQAVVACGQGGADYDTVCRDGVGMTGGRADMAGAEHGLGGGDGGDGGEANYRMPDFVALCEVENDSVMRDLTKRSLLRMARYEYIMTDSPDGRGIDVALMYSPFSFAPIRHYPLRVDPVEGMTPTRDILYVSGRTVEEDTLHIFVVHAPSRRNGERHSRRFREAVARRLCASVDSVRALKSDAKIIVAGDFNDYSGDPALSLFLTHGLADVSAGARGLYGRAKGTYRYNGRWGSLDHILMSSSLASRVKSAFIYDAPFLLEEDKKYGGFKPFRSYTGYRFSADGTSDHLPLVVRFGSEEFIK